MNYIGEECFSCGKKFEKDDDVVVCPECGTPYHRECYKKAGECINHQLHESGGSWKRTEKKSDDNVSSGEESIEGEVVTACPRCGFKNEAGEKYCRRCGLPLQSGSYEGQNQRTSYNSGSPGGADALNQFLGFNPNEDLGGASLQEVSQFVGSNTIYYIPIFKRMKETGSKISFNAVCLLFPYFYFANRKMWLPAIITALITVLLNIPLLLSALTVQSSPFSFMQDIINYVYANESFIVTLSEICNFGDWILKIFSCIFANRIYYRFTLNSIDKMKKRSHGTVTPRMLKEKGGAKPVNILIIGLIIFAAMAAAYFLVMFILLFMQQSGLM